MSTKYLVFLKRKPLHNEESLKRPLFESERSDICKRVLVVDDDPGIRDVLSCTISSMGYEVDTADNGAKGLEKFMKKPFDLVITDLNMPGMDGFTLAARIKAKHPQVMVVLVTGEGRDFVLDRGENCFVDDILFKPFHLKDIQGKVQSMLENEKTEDNLLRISY